MTVNDVLNVANKNMGIKVVGEEITAYGFIRYENANSVSCSIRKRLVKEISTTGVENEFTITVHGGI